MVEKVSFSRIVFNILNYGFMLLICIICVAPLWHVMMASVSNPRELMSSTGLLLKPAGEITFKGYQLVFKNNNILTGYINTLFYVAATTIIGTVLTIIAGFTISRENMKLKTPITIMILFTMIFGGGLIPTYMLIRSLGMIDHSIAVILPGVINAFYIIMMKSSFEQLPASYEESAKIDGAGPLTILVKILVPLVKSTIAIIVMFTIVQQWNSWFPASIYLTRRRDLWPLQLFMREILVQNDTGKILSGSDALSKADYTINLVKYCVTIVGTLPILCIYPFTQKHFVKGVTLGGVKG
ncbi:carbohydrate ABC transporter permease [Anaerobium acetethylicum]|uniref:Putative aldouronate transport system permease protein n=1 Tax=Anaerobium acetethylicum TaxID=1619234 RepID=A0A1D3TX34_9FIRM|nr:carbohydrate ABC transporter permease [Anaerobium acetethylicum]SCP98840.1 putative aldouronate transport system permease protein [Anaerobium acetethylicum]